jgi:hypothetical protein
LRVLSFYEWQTVCAERLDDAVIAAIVGAAVAAAAALAPASAPAHQPVEHAAVTAATPTLTAVAAPPAVAFAAALAPDTTAANTVSLHHRPATPALTSQSLSQVAARSNQPCCHLLCSAPSGQSAVSCSQLTGVGVCAGARACNLCQGVLRVDCLVDC